MIIGYSAILKALISYSSNKKSPAYSGLFILGEISIIR